MEIDVVNNEANDNNVMQKQMSSEETTKEIKGTS